MKKRNGTIDFLKFFCSVIIVIVHAHMLIPKTHFPQMHRGAIAVEFFFLVSGFFLAASADRARLSLQGQPLGDNVWKFIFRKAKTVFPTVFVAVVLCWAAKIALMFINSSFDIKEAVKFTISKFWQMTFLTEAGFGETGEIWYVSAMLLVMFIYYPILLRHFDTFSKICCPLIGVFLIGYLQIGVGSLLNPALYMGFIYKGMIRAFGDIALGVVLYVIIEKIKDKPALSTKRAGVLITLSQVVLWVIIVAMIYVFTTGAYDSFMLLIIFISALLAFTHSGALAEFMDNKFNYFLGRISLTIYLTHKWYAAVVYNLLVYVRHNHILSFGADRFRDKTTFLIIYIVTLPIICAVVHILAGLVRKLIDRIIKPKEKQAA